MAKPSAKGKLHAARGKKTKASGKPKDLSAEEKIKAAARKIFTQKGYAATRTRDIAEEAGINLALLNYYFRSKERLFELVMKENIQLFVGNLVENLDNTAQRPFIEQLEYICSSYVDMLLENPNLPFFIMNIIQSGGGNVNTNDPLFSSITKLRAVFITGLKEEMEKGQIKQIHPLHFLANMMSLIVFPFIAKPLLMNRVGITDNKEFETLMQERKKLIPEWIRSMLKK
jgi:AcrR family transcriptional regulator